MPTDPPADMTRNGGSRPVPDPTSLTQQALERSEAAIHEWVDGQLAIRDERLRGIDEATRLRLSSVDGLPATIDEKVGRLADLTAERFAAMSNLATRESALNKDALVAAFNAAKEAVAAALTAQKESAAVAERTNQAAIDKSERATAETILTNSRLTATRLDALTLNLDDLKERIGKIESVKLGATENRTGIYATIGIVVTVGIALLTIAGFVIARTSAG